MRNHTILLSLLASLTASSGCKQIECAEGTIERNGECVSNTGFDPALCGPFTHLEGDRCVPDFPPTVCDDGTESEVDPETGITVCKGGGIPMCGIPIGCTAPSMASKQTICGQLYDFENGAVFGDAAGTPGAPCDPSSPTTTGPCALQMSAYDALVFAANPATATALQVKEVYIDNCGRFKLTEIETGGTGPFIGLGVDDAGQPFGPTGVTVTTAVATSKLGMTATRDVEGFIVKQTTVGMWQGSGGPPLTGGIYAPIFRKHKAGNPGDKFAPQDGVTITKNGNTIPNNDFYFQAAQTTRQAIDTNATSTGMNGTVLVTGAVASEGLVYGGQGGLGAGCRWDPHAGASLPGIVFIQVFRKLDILGQTCND